MHWEPSGAVRSDARREGGGGEVEKSLGSLRCNERSAAAAVTGRITHPLLGVSTSAAASPPCQRGPGSLAGVGAGVPRERRVGAQRTMRSERPCMQSAVARALLFSEDVNGACTASRSLPLMRNLQGAQ
ncbi:unnamed protein product [Arctogadus glacialis]